MNEGLRKKIAEDIKRSGFHAELAALSVFKKRGWLTSGAAIYIDEDEGKSREVDIEVTRTLARELPSGDDVDCNCTLLAEVKKAEQPWVVFKGIPQDPWRLYRLREELMRNYFGLPDRDACNSIDKILGDHPLVHELGWLGKSMHECFKKPSTRSRWYQGMVTACKAAEFVLKSDSRAALSHEYSSSTIKVNEEAYLHYIEPVVILDGQLVSAELNEEGDITLEEISYAPVCLQFESQSYTRGRYYVPLVALSSLRYYLELLEVWQDELFQEMFSICQRRGVRGLKECLLGDLQREFSGNARKRGTY